MASSVVDSGNSSLDFLRTSNLIGFVRMRSNGVFVEANNAFLGLVGYSREELVGKMSWRDVTPPEFSDVSSQAHHRVLRTGTTEPFEKEYLRKDGNRITVLIGSVRAKGDDVVGFILDITQRKINERALAKASELLGQSESRFRRLMDANVIGVGFFHMDGRFLDANDVLLGIAGMTRADLQAGRFRWDHLTPPEYRHLDERALEQLRTTGKCAPYEKEYLRPDGRRVAIVVASAFLEGKSDEGFCFVLDNSARVAAEKALQDAHRSLEQRVEERTAELARSEARLRESEEYQRKIAEHNLRLVREVEHRVRNHLANLVGLVQVMREKSTSVQSFADAIESRLRAMAHVHQVLAAGGWDALGLQSLIESTLASLSYMSPHACDITIAGDAVAITAQHALPLALILAEWFTNSIKYGSSGVRGGKVDIHWNIAERSGGAAGGESGEADRKGARPWVTLTWTESAGPPITGEITPSVGTALVQGFATQELSGECEMSYPRPGARYTLRFPLGGCA